VLGTTSDGPMFVACERGYFKEQGIEIEAVAPCPSPSISRR